MRRDDGKSSRMYILAIGAAVLIGGLAIASYETKRVPEKAPVPAQRQTEPSEPPPIRQAAATRPKQKGEPSGNRPTGKQS